jgi:hypothetical protein
VYLSNLGIKNIGPIEELSIEFPFHENGKPKPIIFVGENGAGKTILLSQIVDGLYEIGSLLFDDIGVNSGLSRAYYKISGGLNLKLGESKGFSILSFRDFEEKIIEYVDSINCENNLDFKKLIKDFSLNTLSEKRVTDIKSVNTWKEKLKQEWLNNNHIYQSAYRYEEPFWKNEDYNTDLRFKNKIKFSNNLYKEIEIISSMEINKSYLLDLVLDFINNKNETDIKNWNNINNIIRKIKQKENIRFAIGKRNNKNSRISIVNTDSDGNALDSLLPSVDNLSLGELILLNLFVNIIRHSDNLPKEADELEGIVIIDEIDVHLHTNLQNKVLPELIKMFPKIQFIITTHSPLFILGLEKELGANNIELRNMPNGEIITSERFSEFEKAYKVLNDTKKFEDDLNVKIIESKKPIVFVEGDYDIRYIKKACELFDKEKLLTQITFIDADGYQNLNNIWNHKSNLFKAIDEKMLLLYDCDTKVTDGKRDKILKKIIPYRSENYFDRGIENLFSVETINKAIDFKSAFVDITEEYKQTIRGKTVTIPKKYTVNNDEKGNLCNWLCENGRIEDFKNFEIIFEIFGEFLEG